MPANQAAITRSAVCPTEKKMEPQITQKIVSPAVV
jgi:hypothetical protein